MSSEQDKDLVAKKNACCMQSTWRGAYFLQSGDRLSEDPAPLAHTSAPLAKRKMPFGNLLIPESVE